MAKATFTLLPFCCILVLLIHVGSTQRVPLNNVVFPYVIQTPHYNATWKSNVSPAVEITAFLPNATSSLPTRLFSIDLDYFLEIQGNDSAISTWKTGSELSANFNRTILIDYLSASRNYSTFPILEPNRVGIQFLTQLPNGAIFDFNYTINPNSSFYIPIPHERDCTKYRPRNCSCEPDHFIELNSLKFTFRVTDWPFAPLTVPGYDSYFRLQTTFSGPFNFDYYSTLPDFTTFVDFGVCDVGTFPFNLTTNNIPGQVVLPFSVFNNFLRDGEVKGAYCVIGSPFINEKTTELSSTVGFIFRSFNESLFYDPDFSVLIAGVNHGTGSGGGAGDGGGKNGGALQGGAIAGIVIGCVAVGVLVALAVGTAVIAGIYVKRRITQRSSDIRF
eukprot:TRINITY_DN722_c0_g3_i2.p2 TRINITY_DN722_c0_g3~~TRINITY_DN722_c0_g3_i2.p2  ORF type:complete len:388 (-),score=69.38 TRINITY_DN722_c0_g3_i2:1459-2622(-)